MLKFWMLGIVFVTFLCAPITATDTPKSAVRLADPGIGDQDDMCVCIHPTNPEKSTVVTSDKKANKLFVYDLDGKTLQTVDVKQPGNIDTRSGFPFANGKIDIVVVNLRDEKKLAVFKSDPKSRRLARIDGAYLALSAGVCLKRLPRTPRKASPRN